MEQEWVVTMGLLTWGLWETEVLMWWDWRDQLLVLHLRGHTGVWFRTTQRIIKQFMSDSWTVCATMCFWPKLTMQQFSETSTSSTFSSSNVAGNSVISTSSIIMYSEIIISTAFSGQSRHGTTSTTANSTFTDGTYSYLTPTTTALYTSPASTISTSSSGVMFSRPTPTPSISSMRVSSKPTLTPADPEEEKDSSYTSTPNFGLIVIIISATN